MQSNSAVHTLDDEQRKRTEPDIRKRAWLHLLHGGGRWGCEELSVELNCSRKRIQATLQCLTRLGMVVRHGPEFGRPCVDSPITYSVSAKCKVPKNIILIEIYGQT